MQLPWGLVSGSLTELAGVGAAVLGTVISVAYTRHTFQLTQQPAWRVTVGEVTYLSTREDGISMGEQSSTTEWVIRNFGKLGALEVTTSLALDRRLRSIDVRPGGAQPVKFASIEPDQAMIIASGTYSPWPTWRSYADARAKLQSLRRTRDRVRVDWIDTRGRPRSRNVPITWRPLAYRSVPVGDEAPTFLSGVPRPEDS